MRILITNDDGINAPGLGVLEQIARAFAGAEAELWTVAPAFEKSGVAHCINYAHPTLISQLQERRFMVEGNPADCVLAGLYEVMVDCPPDLILSGVNKGNNSGENALYSGTLGAAMEGALQGIPSLALSQYFGPQNAELDNPFEAAATHGAEVIRKVLSQDPGAQDGYRLFYNVNFPPLPADAVKGTRAAPQGLRIGNKFHVVGENSPSRRRFLWASSGNQHGAALPADSDAALNMEGYTTVVPMRADLTDPSALPRLAEAVT